MKKVLVVVLPFALSFTACGRPQDTAQSHAPATPQSVELRRASKETSLFVWADEERVYAKACETFILDTPEEISRCKTSAPDAHPPMALAEYRAGLLAALPLDAATRVRLANLRTALADLLKIDEPASRDAIGAEISATRALIASLEAQAGTEADALIARLKESQVTVNYYGQKAYALALAPWQAGAEFTGVATQVKEAVFKDRWSECHRSPYNGTVNPVDALKTRCAGSQVMIACGKKGSGIFTLAAIVDRAALLAGQAPQRTEFVPESVQGVGAYYSPGKSLGFVVGGDKAFLNSCDFGESATHRDKRLCWHVDGSNSNRGYRCGANDLNAASDWERIVLTR